MVSGFSKILRQTSNGARKEKLSEVNLASVKHLVIYGLVELRHDS